MKITNTNINISFDGTTVNYQAAVSAELANGQQNQTLGLTYNSINLPFDNLDALTDLLTAYQTKVLTQAKTDLTPQ